jgi:hypothetical protein
VQLSALPETGLVDEPVAWRVDGVPTGERVRLRITTTDATGREWRSDGSYRAGDDGVLEVADPDTPWTMMAPVDTTAVPVTFTAPDDAWVATAVAASAGDEATTTVHRVYARGVARRELSGERWRLRCYEPSGASLLPAVLLVPGSTGVAALAPTAALLASRGHATAVLAYVEEPGLPASMREIPVEIVAEAARAFTALDTVDGDRLVVWAVSVGTGLVLSALSSSFPLPLRGVVVVSPTDVVWQALGAGGPPPKASSLSRDAQEVPWLRMHGERLLGQVLTHVVTARLPGRPRSTAMRLRPAYDRSKDDPGTVSAAAIPVEQIDAPLLLVAGTADAMWPSVTMAQSIVDRRREHGVGDGDELVVLPDAGHFMRPPATPTTVDRTADLVSGGSPEGVARGQRTAWTRALAFLNRVFEPAPLGE